jgi:hypothetical protein
MLQTVLFADCLRPLQSDDILAKATERQLRTHEPLSLSVDSHVDTGCTVDSRQRDMLHAKGV